MQENNYEKNLPFEQYENLSNHDIITLEKRKG